jgi:uncharacterized protein (TIGR03437 family)
LLAAIDYWNTIAPFKILPRTSEPNYVTFRKIEVDAACSSSVGMVGGQQFVNVTPSCTTGSAIHELGHAWGLMHEQERADRDAYVTILYDNIDKRFRNNFDQGAGDVDAGYYDYDSIMHYAATGFSRNFRDTIATVPPGIPIGQRVGLSAGDTDGVRRLYGAIPTETTITSTPTGLTLTIDGATVKTPQTFNWPPGSQHTVSAPDTQGSSPRYVFARWSDAGAASHTITSSGSVTVYCADFQAQYPVTAGVASGAGTVSVIPAPKGGYLPDREQFQVTATPAAGSRLVRWMGTTYLGASGASVSASPANVQLFGAASDYEALFTTGPLHVVDSQPRGAQVQVDGTTYFTPVSFSWAAGSTHSIGYTDPQLQGNNTHRFAFQQWEDGSTGTRSVTASAQETTYTATFKEQYLLSTGVIGNGTVGVTPPAADGFYDVGSTVTVTAAPAAGQALRYWLGDAAGTNPARTVVMDQQRAVTAYFSGTLPWLMFNSASYMINPTPGTTGQAVAPGEIVAIFGTNIGPATTQPGQIGSDGRLATSIGGVSVTFGGLPAPITYASPNQMNVIAPYGIAGVPLVSVAVRTPAGNLTFSVTVVDTVPGLYTYDGSGQGPVAALNQEGSINSAANPAAPGSVVVLFGTGAGVLAKSFPDGQIMGSELVSPTAPVLVRFDKLAGQVLYAGAAPTLVNGALQVNAVVPSDLVGGGQVSVRIVSGTSSSPPGTTIWIK